tara:strand:+ start:204 stop:1064 length:861 start_codon:yes stop_codon:yes gene_type:complete
MVYSFFNRDSNLRLDAFEVQAETVAQSAAAGLAALGIGSEASKLSLSERLDTVELLICKLAKRKPLITTVFGNTPKEQIEFGKRAIKLGTDALILQPPQNPLSDKVLMEFFSEIIQKLNIPLGIQNAPNFLGFGLSEKSIIKLAKEYSNFEIAKLECSSVELESIVRGLKDKIMVFNGRCGLELTDNLRAGANGIIPGMETVDKTSEIFRLFSSQKVNEADELYSETLPVLCFIMQDIPHFLTYGKMLAANRLGLDFGGFRKSALNPTKFGIQCIKRFTDQLGRLC